MDHNESANDELLLEVRKIELVEAMRKKFDPRRTRELTEAIHKLVVAAYPKEPTGLVMVAFLDAAELVMAGLIRNAVLLDQQNNKRILDA